MNDLLHRTAVALLFIGGLLTAAQAFFSLEPAPAAWSVVRHHQFMLVLVGSALALSAFVPALRLSATGFALLAQVGFVAISLADGSIPSGWAEAGLLATLLLAGGVFLREARQEARWDRMLPLRSEG
jgi:hypothetical protein